MARFWQVGCHIPVNDIRLLIHYELGQAVTNHSFKPYEIR